MLMYIGNLLIEIKVLKNWKTRAKCAEQFKELSPKEVALMLKEAYKRLDSQQLSVNN